MAKWYVKRNNMQVGPFETAQLKQLAVDGKIKPADLIRREDQTSWSNASDVKGLIAATSVQAAASQPLKPSLQPECHTPPPLPEKTKSLSISEGQISVSKLLLAAIVGSLVINALCLPWVSVDEDGFPVLPFAFLIYWLTDLVYVIADTVLLFVSWRSLPKSKRPFALHPAFIVAATFIPLIGYAAYFFAYGKIGTLWLEENDKVPELAGRKDVQPLRWMGYLLAGWIAFTWLMEWAMLWFDMSWWHNPLAQFGGKHVVGKYLSLQSFNVILLAFWYASFYYSQILIWTGLLQGDANPKTSAPQTISEN